MKIDYNTKQIEEATKRRAKLYKQFIKKKLPIKDFAKLHGISRQRMQIIIAKAITDSVRL